MVRFRYVGPRTRPDGTVGVRMSGRTFLQADGVNHGRATLKRGGARPHPLDTDEITCRPRLTVIEVDDGDAIGVAAFRTTRGVGGVVLYEEMP